MIDFHIYEDAHRGPPFWADLGPYISSRAVHKELGGPIFDDSRYVWVITKENGSVVGWGALIREPDKNLVTMDWTYVVLEHRKRGIYSEMRKRLLSLAGGAAVRGMSKNPIIQRFYEREGYAHTGSRGAWRNYEKKGVSA